MIHSPSNAAYSTRHSTNRKAGGYQFNAQELVAIDRNRTTMLTSTRTQSPMDHNQSKGSTQPSTTNDVETETVLRLKNGTTPNYLRHTNNRRRSSINACNLLCRLLTDPPPKWFSFCFAFKSHPKRGTVKKRHAQIADASCSDSVTKSPTGNASLKSSREALTKATICFCHKPPARHFGHSAL